MSTILYKLLNSRLISTFLMIGLVVVTPAHAWGEAKNICAESPDLALVNGKIVTMDKQNSIVSSVLIKDGKIAHVGHGAGVLDPSTKTIDLHGMTVIPGLYDNHMHYIRTALLPGHDMRELETAFSIADALDVISGWAVKVPNGEWLTALGGIKPNQFDEKRFPTLDELNAAAPNHPVWISVASSGPGQTNNLAKEFLESNGVLVGPDGAIARGADTVAAWEVMSALHTHEDTKRQMQNQMDYALSLGLTTILDNGGTIASGGWLAPDTGYDFLLELMREGNVPIRLRINLPILDTEPDAPQLQGRLDNAFRDFGNDMVKIVGLGEWLIPMQLQGMNPLPVWYEDSCRKAAERGWFYMQHIVNDSQAQAHLDVWERVNKDFPLADLRWSFSHCYGLSQKSIDRAKALGIGMGTHSALYLSDRGDPNGSPPFRTILKSGILHVGGGSDGARISTMNPWVMIYYAVTGKNSNGDMINPGQTLTRMEALRLWTAEQGWFSKEEDKLGSIEVGKLADLVVLSDDYLDTGAVSDDDIRRLSSVLTIVGGKIVHDKRP